MAGKLTKAEVVLGQQRSLDMTYAQYCRLLRAGAATMGWHLSALPADPAGRRALQGGDHGR